MESRKVFGVRIIELTCLLKRAGSLSACIWCVRVFIHLLLFAIPHVIPHMRGALDVWAQPSWHQTIVCLFRQRRDGLYFVFRKTGVICTKALSARLNHANSRFVWSSGCRGDCNILHPVLIFFPRLFQKGPEPRVHCELLVFGLGANQAGEQRPRHAQRHLQQQRHCPSGTRGRGCHQTLQKGQSWNWTDDPGRR